MKKFTKVAASLGSMAAIAGATLTSVMTEHQKSTVRTSDADVLRAMEIAIEAVQRNQQIITNFYAPYPNINGGWLFYGLQMIGMNPGNLQSLSNIASSLGIADRNNSEPKLTEWVTVSHISVREEGSNKIRVSYRLTYALPSNINGTGNTGAVYGQEFMQLFHNGQ